MTRKILWLLLATVIVTAGCEAPVEPNVRVAPQPRFNPENGVVVPQQRPPTDKGPRVVNAASGVSRPRIRRAVADLKTVRMWRRLTRQLAVIQIQARSGRARVPSDGHLADAYWTAVVEPDVVGGLCSISFYPAAVAADRRRSRALFARRLGPPLPRARLFWASLLAHELAHCLPGQPGERTARRWERRAVAQLGTQARS